MTDPLRIKVRCFSQLRYALGASEIEIELLPPASLGDVARQVREMGGPAVAALPFRLALNKAFAEEDTPVHEGDEVALISPVQGG